MPRIWRWIIEHDIVNENLSRNTFDIDLPIQRGNWFLLVDDNWLRVDKIVDRRDNPKENRKQE